MQSQQAARIFWTLTGLRKWFVIIFYFEKMSNYMQVSNGYTDATDIARWAPS